MNWKAPDVQFSATGWPAMIIVVWLSSDILLALIHISKIIAGTP